MKSRKKDSTIEIGLCAALIAVAILGVVLVLGPALSVVFPKIQAAL